VLKKLIIGASVMLVLATGFVFAGQNTGGDKNKRGITSGLNPATTTRPATLSASP